MTDRTDASAFAGDHTSRYRQAGNGVPATSALKVVTMAAGTARFVSITAKFGCRVIRSHPVERHNDRASAVDGEGLLVVNRSGGAHLTSTP
jgi:hypothetical protein